jgi:hypothetical protein
MRCTLRRTRCAALQGKRGRAAVAASWAAWQARALQTVLQSLLSHVKNSAVVSAARH